VRFLLSVPGSRTITLTPSEWDALTLAIAHFETTYRSDGATPDRYELTSYILDRVINKWSLATPIRTR
jgi:hypothetical protein